MSPATQYHSINNVDIEHAPDGQSDKIPRQRSSNNEPDGNPDSSSGLDPEATAHDSSLSRFEGGGHSQELRLGPGLLNQERLAIKFLSWTWEVVLTALPLFFFAISILALRLDEQVRSTSTYGPTIEEITRLSPTIYPVLFAMIAARFYRNAARWHLERPGGITVASLEQIIGSSSFASALERLFIIRTQPILGVLILSTWAMSPLGGQSSSRLLRIDEKKYRSKEWIYYDIRNQENSTFYDMDKYTYGPADIIQALYPSCLFSPRKQRQSSMDLLGRPKIPQWPYDSMQDIEETAWRMVDKNALEAGIDYYTSLIGINVQDLNLSGSSTLYEFEVESDYIGFDCSFIGRNVSDLEKFSFHEYDTRNETTLADIFADASAGDRRPSSFVAALEEPIIISATPHMLYTSWSDGGHYYVLNCTADNVNIRTTLACTSQGCSPQRQLRIRNPWPAIAEGWRHHRRLYAFQNALAEWPRLTYAREGLASATENYIADDDNVFADQSWQNWTEFDTKVFSRRVTTAFNTVWHAGLDWYNVTKSSLAVPEDPSKLWTNKTEARITRTEDAYYVNRFWMVVLMLTTTILQVLAVGGLVLRYLIRGPDILGYASSLTRDNQFASVLGGSYLDGAERARSLRNVRVQLADVKPEESCGYIALNVVPFPASAGGDSEEGKGENQASGHMEKGRMYA
ncbi:hypothetical protein CSOJ01_15636 [Colletotrichum sojae]|uniref:Uncharacterized protein n=1 Tax=Colletotrichum sojae TaxID=2175907 RepID=A0A8H6MHB2_9PEZI|nr:hypothetical protein CSOJ01_15636 [Colletotrichum sojae]